MTIIIYRNKKPRACLWGSHPTCGLRLAYEVLDLDLIYACSKGILRPSENHVRLGKFSSKV